MKKSEKITHDCVRWYRVYGNACKFSVWKVISLAKMHYGLQKMSDMLKDDCFEISTRMQRDLLTMDLKGVKNDGV